MKLPIYDLEGKKSGEIDVGQSLSSPVRSDIITRCFLAEQALTRQPYGTDWFAGKRTSAHYHGERGTRYSMMNKEMARLRRIHGNQGYLSMTARFSPQAIKGRAAHPPKSEKNWLIKVNKKERMLGLISSLAASSDKSIILNKGYVLPENLNYYPIIVEDRLEKIKNTKEAVNLFRKLGFEKEMERSSQKKVRAGKGKSRGRKYKKKAGPLVIVKDDKGASKSIKNIAGFDCVLSKDLSVSKLSPGGHPGRLVILTESAMKELLGVINKL
ncbi:MAG TPA: 50S ribosomal protein L4 [archaeon]|nr:50S ribosomal protein L4 [archaeon]